MIGRQGEDGMRGDVADGVRVVAGMVSAGLCVWAGVSLLTGQAVARGLGLFMVAAAVFVAASLLLPVFGNDE